MEVENWLPIKGYEGIYEVSDLGRVRSLKFEKTKVLQLNISSNKYLALGLCKDGKKKTYNVYVLVAIAFLNHVPNGRITVVNHINFDRLDNRLVNLELVSFRENTNKKHLLSTSKYTGVCWCKTKGKWKASVHISKKINLGYFTTELEAHYAYEESLTKIKK